jgi:hypothetical protein
MGMGGILKHVIGISGGKDSVAMALRLQEVEPRDYIYLITPTGDELPEMVAHWERLECMLGAPLTRVTCGKTLTDLIQIQNALPSWRMRWCTRMLKIEPTIAWLRQNQPALLYVGLRADEEERQGIYSSEVQSRFPLREWGWTIDDVWGYLAERGVRIPKRTDCARCYDQRIVEWKNLWREHPAIYADAEHQEIKIGNTFRSPGRDAWPASLAELRQRFEAGDSPRGEKFQLPLFEDVDERFKKCRVCSL